MITFEFTFFVICNLQNVFNNVAALPTLLIPAYLICITVNIGCIAVSGKIMLVLASSGYGTVKNKNTAMDRDLGLSPFEVLHEFSISSHTVAYFVF